MFISKDIVFSSPVIFHFKVGVLLNKFMDLRCYWEKYFLFSFLSLNMKL